MKLKIITFIIFLDSIVLFGQFLEQTLAKNNRINIAIKEVYFGGENSPSMTYTEKYDTNGYLRESISFSHNLNSTLIRQYYFYNEFGTLTYEIGVHYSKGDSTIDSIEYSYNEFGYLERNSFGPINYKYDDFNKVVEKIEIMPEESFRLTKYEYNLKGNLILSQLFDENVLISKNLYEYNSNDQIVRETKTHLGNDTAIYLHTFEYNDKGLKVKEIQKEIVNTRLPKMKRLIEDLQKKSKYFSRMKAEPENRIYIYKYYND